MTIFYHGTTANDALKIAERGAIVSLWDQEKEFLQKLRTSNPKSHRNLVNTMLQKYNVDDEDLIALHLASDDFKMNESHRVKYIRLDTSISSLPFAPETILGLEIERPPERFYPERASLDALREVHFERKYEQVMKEAFARYKPKFIKI